MITTAIFVVDFAMMRDDLDLRRSAEYPRSAARLAGSSTYISRRPCPRDGTLLRWCDNRCCRACEMRRDNEKYAARKAARNVE
jgi:hypothetical protein